MSTPINLSVSQQFEIERFSRAIDATADTSELRSIAKQLLQAWHTQKAATNWVIAQQMAPPSVSELPNMPRLDDAAM
ncbi:MAG: hypothetical protein ACO24U_02015 [Prochlorococcaceae cyanobacterium]|jgi:hypothetical protein